jgi:excisionase family DNA binding protein
MDPSARPGIPLALTVSPELLDAIAEAVAAKLGAAPTGARTASPFVDVDEAAEILRAKKQRVYDLVHDGKLERCGDGRRLLLRRDDVMAYAGGGS